MDAKQLRELVLYWQITAEHDYDTMVTLFQNKRYLFQNKRYSDSLFFGHIILEKILKAHVVKTTKEQAPFIHDLVRLANLTKLEFSE